MAACRTAMSKLLVTICSLLVLMIRCLFLAAHCKWIPDASYSVRFAICFAQAARADLYGHFGALPKMTGAAEVT